MERNMELEAKLLIKRQKRHRTWMKLLSVMACVVVFCTTYALILPAITKETNVFCGHQGHLHEDGCYEIVLTCEAEEAHIHSDACYETELRLVCPLAETLGHRHSEACNGIELVLSCGLEESSEHSHGEACYTEMIVNLCGLEEEDPHTHDSSCYLEEEVLVCSLDEGEEHIHTEACYTEMLICELEEHEHTKICYSNPNADIEYAANWEATLPQELTGIYTEDVLAIAKSQLGYTESARNYEVMEDGVTTKGYTRYGAWYGVPYGDWCAMFVSFCLSYAEVEDYPLDCYCPTWINELTEKDLYRTPSEYIPKSGDIIFFDWEQDGISDHVGLVEAVEDTTVTTIEGNSGECVARNTYELFDPRIVGYGVLIQSQSEPEEEPESQPQDTVISNNEDQVFQEEPQEQTQDTVVIDQKDTAAWVELIDEAGQSVAEEPQEEASQQDTSQAVIRETGRKFLSIFSKDTADPMDSSMKFAIRPAAYRAGVPLDLTPYINMVSMYDSRGNAIPSGASVSVGDMIEFQIEYTVTGQQLGVMNNETITVTSDTLVYTIPKIFELIQGDSGNIVNASKQVVGSYLIDNENGLITLTFTEDYVKQNATGIQIHGYISFFSTVKKITDIENETQSYHFTDNIVLGVVIEENIVAMGDLSLKKQAISVDGEELTYEVKITSTEGTTGSITITDQMSEGLSLTEGIEIWKADGTPVTDAEFILVADSASFTLTLPEMAAGESYTVRYQCTADLDLLDVNMTVRNTASVTGKDNQGHELKDERTVEHTFDVLKKTGVVNDDGTITWRITVNQAKADISGWILEDLMGNVPYTGVVTVGDTNGNVLYENMALPITFPEGSKDTYVITYSTRYGIADGDIVYNKAILKDKDTDVTVLTGVDVSGGSIQKTGEAGAVLREADGNYLLPITWTVSIDASNSAISANKELRDKMDGLNHANDVYMTYDQLLAAINAIDAELKRVGSGIARVEVEAFVSGSSVGEIYTWEDLEKNSACKSLLYEGFAIELSKEVPQGCILTFTYQTYGVFSNHVIADADFRNRFNISGNYEVEASVKYFADSIQATKYAMNYYDPNSTANQDWALHWNSEEGTGQFEYEKLHDSYLAWAIKLTIPSGYSRSDDIVIYEDLPEGVTVKGLDLSFQDSVPTSRLEMRNLVPGNTHTWDSTVYPVDQYDVWEPDRTGAQNVSIAVTLTEAEDLEITIPGIIFQTMGNVATRTNAEEWTGYLYIYTQIDEDFEWTPETEGSYVYVNAFENRFTMKSENGDVIDIGSQTQVIKKDESDGIIHKVAATDDNNTISYSVVLNAYKKDLVQNSGTLSIHDELRYTSTEAQMLRLRLVLDSVKLYEISVNPDGSYTKLGEVTAKYDYEETSSAQYGITTWIHTIDLSVPDSKALLLEYTYGVSGEKQVRHNVLNTCTIKGVGEGSLDGDCKMEIEVKNSMAQADTAGVMIRKVDADNNGLFLENAKFHIYIWNQEQNNYILVHHPDNGNADFITDANGTILLDGSTMAEDQFAYNTAYYIVETEAPDGYYLDPEPYYFYIANTDMIAYPSCIPEGFAGDALVSGDIICRKNVSEATEIRIEKYWQSYNGPYITVTEEQVSAVTIELWQMLQGEPDSAKLYGTYTMTPDAEGNWSLSITDLPKTAERADGTASVECLYYIKEVGVSGFVLETTENNEGINSGIIKLVNREEDGYSLPKTGGVGTVPYTLGGLLLMIAAAMLILMYYKASLRKGGK